MILYIIIFVILLISFAWALASLRNLNASRERKKVSDDLKRGKVLFTRDHRISSSEEN